VTLQPRLSECISEQFDGRYTYFMCQRLFAESEAASLLTQFPTSEIEALRRPEVSHATLSSLRHPELVKSFLQSSPDWNTVYDWFTSEEFVADVLTTFRSQIKAKYPPIIRTLFSKWIMNPSRYYGEVQFSLRLTGSVLSPHTDNADKVLALIVYFPDVGETSTGGGTSFYLPRSKRSEFAVFNRYKRFGWLIPLGLRRLQSAKLPTVDSFNASQEVGEHLKFFDRHYRRAFDAPYQLGAAGGFIKNQYSWHDLRLDDVAPGMIRSSLLVNVFLRPSRARALVNRIFTRR